MTHQARRSGLSTLLLFSVLLPLMTLFGVSTSCVGVQALQNSVETLKFMSAFVESIPNLAALWMGLNYCEYTGVVCEDGFVRIQLGKVKTTGFELVGELPELSPSLDGGSVKVIEINMSSMKKIGGTFPASWGRLVLLQQLDLSDTRVGGALPDGWNGMASITQIVVSRTNACKNLPNWNSSSMQRLRKLDLSNNVMRGSLSESFGTFSNRLVEVNIGKNPFCGCLPATWVGTTLQDAAYAANPKLLSAKCNSKNACKGNSLKCSARNSATPAASFPVMLLLSAAVIVSLF